jgi:putative MATE family efflux protein
MKKSRYDLTQGSILRHLLLLTLPLIASHTLQDAFNFVDMVFVGRLGTGALAAIAVSGNLLRLISVLGLGISTGTVIMVSQFVGAKQRSEGENIAMQALILAVVCALGIACIGYPLAELGLKFLGKDEEIVAFGTPYLRVMLLGGVVMFLSMALGSIFRGAGDAITPMNILILSTVFNIVLDAVLIFGFWKFPALGVVGSAYATIIGRGVGVVIMLYLCFSGRGPVSLKHVDRRINLSVMKKILTLGIFSSMQGFLRHVSRVGFISVVAFYGKNVVAAYGICMRLRVFVMNPGFGVANAVAPMVGQNLGAQQIDRAERSVRIGNALAIAVMSLIGILFLFFPHWFVGWFIDQKFPDILHPRFTGRLMEWFVHNPAVLGIGGIYLRVLALTFGFIAASLVLGRALNGAGDTISPMVITGIAQIGIGLILVIILSRLVGIVGIWLGIALANVVQGFMMWLWYRRGTWKLKRLVSDS